MCAHIVENDPSISRFSSINFVPKTYSQTFLCDIFDRNSFNFFNSRTFKIYIFFKTFLHLSLCVYVL